MSVITEAMEEYNGGRGRSGGSWGGDDDRWSVRHGQQRRSIEEIEAIMALWCYRTKLMRGVSVAEVLVWRRSFRPPEHKHSFILTPGPNATTLC